MSHIPDGDGSSATLREFVEVVFRYQGVILATLFITVATVAAGTYWMAPVYQVDSRLLVKFGRENIYRSEIGDDKNQIVTSNTEEILNSEVSILTSRDLIGSVVSTMTVDELYPDLVKRPPRRGTILQEAVDRFADALTVDAVRKSSIIQLSLLHRDPEVAARAMNLLVEQFKDKHLQVYSDPRSSYLEQQLRTYEQRLTQSQDDLQAFKQQHAVFALDEQRTLLLKQRADLDALLKGAQSRIKELQQSIATLTRQLQSVAQDVPLSSENERYRSIDDAKNQLLALQLKEQDLLRQYTDQNQLVVSVRAEVVIVQNFIARQEDDIKARVRTGQNIVYQDLQKDLLRFQTELPSQEAKAVSLAVQLGQLDIQIPTLDRTENGLENLKRDLAINDRNYRAYQERVEAARTLEDLNRQKSANVSVVQSATVPNRPIKPRKMLNMGLAVVLGLLAGLGVTFASEMSSQSLTGPESVERRLGVPVLATIVLRR